MSLSALLHNLVQPFKDITDLVWVTMAGAGSVAERNKILRRFNDVDWGLREIVVGIPGGGEDHRLGFLKDDEKR